MPNKKSIEQKKEERTTINALIGGKTALRPSSVLINGYNYTYKGKNLKTSYNF